MIGLFTWKSFFRIVVLNENPIAFHLWYLQAYIYALGIVLFLAKYHLINKVIYAVPVLLLTDVVFGKYGKMIMEGGKYSVLSELSVCRTTIYSNRLHYAKISR